MPAALPTAPRAETLYPGKHRKKLSSYPNRKAIHGNFENRNSSSSLLPFRKRRQPRLRPLSFPAGLPAPAILQICHGMCEYFLRYRPFAEWLCERGVLVCGADHPGHGQRALEEGSLGCIPGGKDLSLAVEMQQEIYLHLRKTYRHLPYLLLGHSMGSFIARKYITRYKDTVDGVILIGTCAGNQPLSLGIAMADVISFFRGKRRPSRFLMRLAFGHYNDRFPGEKGSAWLSRNKENVKAHDGDPLCRFYFSASAMRQVFGCLREINADQVVR